ncbi:MAG: ATP-binding protein [Clostridiales bacterium]|jgi:DNA replication protein DnaC|nr:ATP-binding protein [Clostridiales bacterium]
MTYKRAVQEIARRREAELFNARSLFEDALRANSALLTAETKIRAVELAEVKGAKTDRKELERLKKERAAVLASMGLTDAVLNPPPRCKLCGDTGLNRDGSPCACAKKLAIDGENPIGIPLRDFADARFTDKNESANAVNQRVFAAVQKITEQFPANKKRDITVLGAPGTGKTFLAGCAANALLGRGASVLAITAFDFVNRMLSYHTTFDDKKLSFISPVLDCDLLIIDDLGTESILKNITLEYLFTVINERMYGDKLTLITTNLSKDALLTRYGERVYSRLCDKNLSLLCVLTGGDVRRAEAR